MTEFSMLSLMKLPKIEPGVFCSSRSKSPTEMCSKSKSSMILPHCVPFPTPGPPRGISQGSDVWIFWKLTNNEDDLAVGTLSLLESLPLLHDLVRLLADPGICDLLPQTFEVVNIALPAVSLAVDQCLMQAFELVNVVDDPGDVRFVLLVLMPYLWQLLRPLWIALL